MLFILFLAVADDYRVALNATTYMTEIAADISLGTPVVSFILYIDNTYFQTPQAVLIYLTRKGSFRPYFLLDNQEEADVIVFSPPGDTRTNRDTSMIMLSRSVLYAEPAPAGLYEYDLVVTVLTRQELSGVLPLRETQVSPLNITVQGKSSYCCRLCSYWCIKSMMCMAYNSMYVMCRK